MYLKVAQIAFDIQVWKQCCSVKHNWMNFNYVSFESMLIILHEIYMIHVIVTHPTTFTLFQGHVFAESGAQCKGVSKKLCVYHLYRNMFLAQTRIRLHLAVFSSLETRFNTHNQITIRNTFRNAFLELSRLSSISQYREYEECQECFHCGAALRNFIRNTMHLKAFQNNFAFISSTETCFWLNCVSDRPFFRVSERRF